MFLRLYVLIIRVSGGFINNQVGIIIEQKAKELYRATGHATAVKDSCKPS